MKSKKIDRSYRLFKSYISSEPSYLILFITSRCNSRCRMCFNWKNQSLNRKKDELTLEEIEKISKNFKNLIQLSVTGGEPFLRDDIEQIVYYFYKNSGTRLITIPTNAILSKTIFNKTKAILEKCPNCLINIGLSLDGIGSDHDNIRGVKENFKNLIETYRLLDGLKKEYSNLYIKATTVLSKFNKDKIEEIFRYVKKNMNVDDHELLFTRGDTRDKNAKDVPIRRYEELLKLVDSQAKENLNKRNYQFSKTFYAIYKITSEILVKTLKENRMILPCLAGKKMIEIYDNADVYPCEIIECKLPRKECIMGNLRDYDYNILKLLKSDKAKRIIDWINNTNCFCTFECAILNSLVFNKRMYFKIFREILSN